MQATILDLRYHMKAILQALDRNEAVEILYHGKKKGTIIPVTNIQKKATKTHAYFGMTAATKKSVQKEIEKLRGDRYGDL